MGMCLNLEDSQKNLKTEQGHAALNNQVCLWWTDYLGKSNNFIILDQLSAKCQQILTINGKFV